MKKSGPPSSTSAPAPSQLTPKQYNKLLALLSKDESNGSLVHLACTILTCLSASWIIDSDASNHICISLSFFSSYSTVHKGISVQFPDVSHAPVTHIGIFHYSSSLILKDVFHIISFKFNLLSISQLTKSSNCDVLFSSSQCIFQDRATKMMIGQGSARNGLFYLDAGFIFNSVFSFKHCNKFNLQHSHLGNPSSSHFYFLVKTFPSIILNKNFVCDVCPRAKKLRLSFPQSSSCSSHCFELLNVEIWDPFSTPSKNGSRFFLTIVDDYSRCTWIYLMKQKSETFHMLVHFFNQINFQFKTKVS